MKLADWLTLAVLGALVAAIWWGRKRGQQRLAASLSAAHAQGFAEGGAAAATAAALQSVNVSVNGERRREDRTAIAARDDHDDYHDLDGAALHHYLATRFPGLLERVRADYDRAHDDRTVFTDVDDRGAGGASDHNGEHARHPADRWALVRRVGTRQEGPVSDRELPGMWERADFEGGLDEVRP